MTENTANENQEVKPTEAELAEAFKALPSDFQTAITTVNKAIEEHNGNVQSILSAESKDPKKIKAEIFEQNPGNNKKLSVLRERELKLIEQIEAIRKQAYEIIDTDGLMPKDLTEAEIEKLKSDTATSVKELRDQVTALSKFEEMMPMFKGKLTPHILEIKTRRGAAKTGSTSGGEGTGPKRLRFKKIEVNGVTQDDQGNKVFGIVDGNEKYTFTFAANYLKKQHKGIKWTPKDLTEAYLSGLDESNLPEIHEFVMPYTFKDNNGNEQTVNYTLKAYR